MDHSQDFTALVLAAQRPGVVNPLAQSFGVSHKCLVPICNAPLIVHVIETLSRTVGVARIRISVEPEIWDRIDALVAPYRRSDLVIDLVAPSPSLADSVCDALEGQDGPFVITTADNVLLTPDAVSALVRTLSQKDVAAVLTTREAVQAVNVHAQRRFYRMAGRHYSNCNLYGMRDQAGLGAAEIFRQGGQFRRNVGRAVHAFGLLNILLAITGLLSVDGAARRLSRRFGLRFAGLVLDDGALAIDVDNARTHAIAREVLATRIAQRGDPAPTRHRDLQAA